ncbi:unnamed protein product [Macrosiphum euphorbiae]|uniref:Uncharacterized protein n=1 Tax=Macrosiphum euphorbiae TaxID=13131 RepID=A0AAV0WSH3_9HEMI|nr:unnamed protein product [Macrosiphum euphorbiae]
MPASSTMFMTSSIACVVDLLFMNLNSPTDSDLQQPFKKFLNRIEDTTAFTTMTDQEVALSRSGAVQAALLSNSRRSGLSLGSH